jgi:hypothetical protein
MSSAHEMTIALSKNSAQSDNIRAAPETGFEFKEGFFIKSTSLNVDTAFDSAE